MHHLKFKRVLSEFTTVKGVRVYRIRHLRTGILGGFIEHDWNLSHQGRAWVHPDACVFDDAWVGEDAQVAENAMIFEQAKIFGAAKVSGTAEIFGKARVSGRAKVKDHAQLMGSVWIQDDTQIDGNTRLITDPSLKEALSLAVESHPDQVYDPLKINELGLKQNPIWEEIETLKSQQSPE